MPTENQCASRPTRFALDKTTTYESKKAEYEKQMKISPVTRCVQVLANDYSYKVEYFTVEDMEKLKERKAQLAIERAAAIERTSKEAENLTKLFRDHQVG